MAACNTLLSGKYKNHFGKYPSEFAIMLMNYSDEGLNKYLQDLWTSSRDLNSAVRAIPDLADPEGEVRNMCGDLKKKLHEIVMSSEYSDYNAGLSYETKRAVIEQVDNVLDFADGVQFAKNKKAVEPEIDRAKKDRAGRTFKSRMTSLFGTELYSSLSRNFKERFADKMVNMLIHDKVRMEMYDMNNKSLNEKIWIGQAKAFESLVDYMKKIFPDDNAVQGLSNRMFDYIKNKGSNGSLAVYAAPDELNTYKMRGTFNLLNFNRAMDLYYSRVVRADLNGFRGKITRQSTESFYNASREETIKQYYEVAKFLEDNGGDAYKKYLSKYGIEKGDVENVKKIAYQGSEMSREAARVMDFIKQNDADGALTKAIMDGTHIDPGMLFRMMSEKVSDEYFDAALNYVFLQNFDDLLDMTMSDIIAIDRAKKGYITYQEDKYSYISSTSGTKKSYIGADTYDTEEYTSEYIKALLNSFEMLHYSKTDRRYAGGRLRTTDLVGAFGRLREGYMSGKFSTGLKGEERTRFMNALYDFSHDPIGNAKTVLEMFFKASGTKYSRESVYENTGRGRYAVLDDMLSRRDVDTLFTFYDAFFDQNNDASVWSIMRRYDLDGNRKNLINRAHVVLSDICGYLASNNALRNMQTSIKSDGTVQNKVARGYLDQFLVKVEKDSINTYANTMRMEKRKVLNQKYNFIYDTVPDPGRTGVRADKSIPTYEVTLRNGEKLRITADNDFGIMWGDESSSNVTISFRGMADGKAFNDAMNGADLSMIKEAYLFGKENDGTVSDNRLTMYASDKVGKYNVQMRAVLEFVDDFLGTNFISNPAEGMEILETYKQRYVKSPGMENFMMPLIKMAMRSAYANRQYIYADKESMDLKSYLSSTQNMLYGNYNTEVNPSTGDYFHIGFTDLYNRLRYNVASNNDSAVNSLADAKSFVRGDNNRTTIRSATGSRIPINSVTRLAQEVWRNFNKAKSTRYDNNKERTSGHLLFADMKGVCDVVQKLDVTAYGKSENYNRMSTADVYRDALLNDFYGMLNSNKGEYSYYTLACDYGDKSTIFKYRVDLNAIMSKLYGGDETYASQVGKITKVTKGDLYNGFANTLGKCYSDLFNDVSAKQERIVRAFIEKYGSESSNDLDSYQRAKKAEAIVREADKRFSRNKAEYDAAKKAYDAAYNDAVNAGKDMTDFEKLEPEKAIASLADDATRGGGSALYDAMKLITENEFVDVAASLGEEAFLHVDYRTVKDAGGKKVLVPNELLRNYSETYNDSSYKKGKLLDEIKKNERGFVETFLNEGMVMQVVRRSSLPYYKGEESFPKDFFERSNPVLEAVRTYTSFFEHGMEYGNLGMELKEFCREWVDSKGRLIYAKQGGKDIVYKLDYNPASEEEMVLNPMLEAYFLIDSLVARNLSHYVAGSEAVNELKYGSPLDIAKKMDLSMFKTEDYAEGYTDAQLKEVLGELRKLDGIDELARKARGVDSGDATKTIYEKLLEECYDYSKSSGQGTNNKRASLALTTARPAVMNTLEGVLNNYKIACLGNIEASAWNMNGETTDGVDVAEGSAVINPCQKRFEDKSFGPYAIPGDVSKTVHVQFEPKNLGMIILKQASQAISNNLMRLTEKAGGGKNINYRRIFKQMSNAQILSDLYESDHIVVGWNDGGYRLNKLDSRNDYEFMQDQIFEGKLLYYEGRHGERKRIDDLKFSETVETDPQTGMERERVLYYTLEGDGTIRDKYAEEEYNESFEPKTVYHLFYDRANPDGTVEESVHMTTDSLDAAKKLMEEYKDRNIHTINSVYELHVALGGMDCVDSEGNWSERNLDVLTNFCNFIVSKRRSINKVSDSNFKFDQDHYRQPLKESLIAYFAPPSTMKKTIANINPTEAWYDGRKVRTMTVSADGLGMVMNAGKDITEAEVSESTQMISIINMGADHHAADSLEKSIGLYMVEKSGELLPLMQKFVESVEPKQRQRIADELTALIGNIVLKNSTDRSYESIAESVLNNVGKYMFKHASREEGESYGLPMSAPEIYKDLMGTISNFFTNNVIKREFPGAGFVLVPSKDRVKYYEVRTKNADGSWGDVEKLEPMDVLERAREEYRSDLMKYLTDPKRKGKAGFNIIELVDTDGNPDGHKLTVEVGAAKERLNDENVNLDIRIEDMKTADLERIALEYDKNGRFSEYYSAEKDLREVDMHMMDVWLKNKSKDARTFDNREWFMPSDVVDVIDAAGNVVETVSLDSMEKYLEFKKKGLSPETGKKYDRTYKYRENVTSSRDLRPSTLRWKYKDGNGVEHWMNYFDMQHVEEVVLNGGDPRSAAYKLRCKAALEQIHKGRIEVDGEVRMIYDLEQGNAEAVLGNMYAELFGINPGDSLAKVKSKGLDYFIESVENSLRAPATTDYDLVFLRTNGDHTLISFSEPANDLAIESEFRNTITKANGEIVLKSGEKELFTVGKWNDVRDGSVSYDSTRKKFIVASTQAEVDDPNMYRYNKKEGVVQKRYDLVKRYEKATRVSNSKGDDVVKKLKMYCIADQSVFDEAYAGVKKTGVLEVPEWVKNKINETVVKIYNSGDYEIAEGTMKWRLNDNERARIAGALDALSNEMTLDPLKKRMLDTLSSRMKPAAGENRPAANGYDDLKAEYVRKLAQRKQTSFNESLKIIAGRIPATGMQSFMAMDIVGWTGKSTNEAYVSHFQIYLQGSDYDIDKANILGNSFTSSGVYAGWSPYFDYTSKRTLEASKKLPLPDKSFKTVRHARAEIRDKKDPNKIIQRAENGVDITDQLARMIRNSKNVTAMRAWGDEKAGMKTMRTTDGMDETSKVMFLEAMAEAYELVAANNGIYTYDSERLSSGVQGLEGKGLVGAVDAAVGSLYEHHRYNIPDNLYEETILNHIASKIWTVSTDIRNMLESQTPISTRRINDASKKTPKALSASKMLPDNVNEKYYSMVDSVSAKRVTAIGANGGRGWNTIFQVVNMAIESSEPGRIRRMMFNYDSEMIEGRSGGIENVRPRKVNIIPDLDMNNSKVREACEKVFLTNPSELRYADVENALSELTNAATDNGKLLLLNKINCTPEYAGMYIAILQLGFSVDDAVSFMTSPYAELMVSMTSDSIFSRNRLGGNKNAAINAAKGRLKSKKYLHGDAYSRLSAEDKAAIEDMADDPDVMSQLDNTKTKVFGEKLRKELGKEKYGKLSERVLRRYNELKESEKGGINDLDDLDTLVQSFILASAESYQETEGKDIVMMSDLFNDESVFARDYDVSDYLEMIDSITLQIRKAALDYTKGSTDGMSERCKSGVDSLLKDSEEMERVQQVTDEITTETVAYLSLNQGVPWDEGDLFSKLRNMNRAFTQRESALGIDIDEMYSMDKDGSIRYKTDKDGNPVLDQYGRKVLERRAGFDEAVEKIKKNSPQYVARESDYMYIEDAVERKRKADEVQKRYDEEIKLRLDDAAERRIIGKFDITEAMRNKGYRDVATRYLDLIKAFSNSLDTAYAMPNYAKMMDCLSFVYELRKLTAKGRLLDMIYHRYGNDYMLKKENISKIHSYIDEKVIMSYLEDSEPIVLNKQIEGFSKYFDEILCDEINLGTSEGRATFKKFVEERYFEELGDNMPENGFIRNVQKTEIDGRMHLKATFDISNPYSTTESKEKYESMVKGLARLQDERFEYDDKISVADVFFLYDLIENKGATNKDSLKNAFKEVDLNRGVIGDYYQKISRYDADLNYIPEFNERDFLISTAPFVNKGTEMYHDERFIKVKRDDGGFNLMEYDDEKNTYNFISINPALNDTSGEKGVVNKRVSNYMLYSTLIHPSYSVGRVAHETLAVDRPNKAEVRSLLLNKSISGDVYMYVIC